MSSGLRTHPLSCIALCNANTRSTGVALQLLYTIGESVNKYQTYSFKLTQLTVKRSSQNITHSASRGWREGRKVDAKAGRHSTRSRIDEEAGGVCDLHQDSVTLNRSDAVSDVATAEERLSRRQSMMMLAIFSTCRHWISPVCFYKYCPFGHINNINGDHVSGNRKHIELL